MTGKQNKGYISLLRVAYQGNSGTALQGLRNWDTACYCSGCMPSEQAKMQSLLAEATLRALPWRQCAMCLWRPAWNKQAEMQEQSAILIIQGETVAKEDPHLARSHKRILPLHKFHPSHLGLYHYSCHMHHLIFVIPI